MLTRAHGHTHAPWGRGSGEKQACIQGWRRNLGRERGQLRFVCFGGGQVTLRITLAEESCLEEAGGLSEKKESSDREEP